MADKPVSKNSAPRAPREGEIGYAPGTDVSKTPATDPSKAMNGDLNSHSSNPGIVNRRA